MDPPYHNMTTPKVAVLWLRDLNLPYISSVTLFFCVVHFIMSLVRLVLSPLALHVTVWSVPTNLNTLSISENSVGGGGLKNRLR